MHVNAKDLVESHCSESRIDAVITEKFNETYREWIRAQQDDFDKHGIWSEGLIPWQKA